MRLLTLRRILAATDLDASSGVVLAAAHGLARASGAALHVVHVVPQPQGSAPPPHGLEQAEVEVRGFLRRAHIPEDGVSIHVIPGTPAEAIRSLADRIGADVMVVGPHRQRESTGGGRALGGTARAIVERAYAPCLVVAQPLRLPLARVLVPVDFSDTARGALLVGLSWASALRVASRSDAGTALTALHVAESGAAADADQGRATLDAELAVLRDVEGSWGGVGVQGCIERDADPAQAICRYAREQHADLIVLGTRGHTADDDARLGSVSMAVTLGLPAPTLLVPPGVWRAYTETRGAAPRS